MEVLGPQTAVQALAVGAMQHADGSPAYGPGTGEQRKKLLPSVSVHQHVAEFRAVAEKALQPGGNIYCRKSL